MLKNHLSSILILGILTGSLFWVDYGVQQENETALAIASMFQTTPISSEELQANIQGSIFQKTDTPFLTGITLDHLQIAGLLKPSLSSVSWSQSFLSEIKKNEKLSDIRSYTIFSNEKEIIRVNEIKSGSKKEALIQFEALITAALTQSIKLTRTGENTMMLSSNSADIKRIALIHKNSVFGLEYHPLYHPQVQTLIQTIKAL